jgi:chaperonin GroES
MHANKIKPLGKRVVIKRAEAKTTKGGIILPDTAKEKPKMGVVIAVGPGYTDEDGKLHPMNVAVGDEILFSAYSGVEVKSDEAGVEYLILSEDDILGVVCQK